MWDLCHNARSALQPPRLYSLVLAPRLVASRPGRCFAGCGNGRMAAARSAAGEAAGLALYPAGTGAQSLTNLTYGEVKFGVLAHDAGFLGGKEHGVDLNPEIIMP